MIVTLEKVNGAGLAANQVGEPVRLFIIRDVIKTKVTDKTGESKEKLTLGKPEVFINPVLSNPSKATTITRQGCLSLPDLSLDVERPSSIYIKALNIKGEPIEEMATGYKAVEIQHEYDHLNGILMVDKAKYKDRKEKKKVKKYLKELAKKQKELNKNIPEK